jgi:Fe2+ or Zn2+ uptake regulation protein
VSKEIAERLRRLGILPSAQRVAVAEYVLSTCTHPCAEDVYQAIQGEVPMISLATVYNALHLFAEKGLLRELSIAEGKVVYDCCVEPHHHIIDVETGAIHDLPWTALSVSNAEAAAAGMGFDVDEYQVLLRGKRRPGTPPKA